MQKVISYIIMGILLIGIVFAAISIQTTFTNGQSTTILTNSGLDNSTVYIDIPLGTYSQAFIIEVTPLTS